MKFGQTYFQRLALGLIATSLTLGTSLSDAAATSPEIEVHYCGAGADIPESLICLQHDIPSMPVMTDEPCELSVTLKNTCETALSFYDAECIAASAEAELDESCLLAEISAGAELEIPTTFGTAEQGDFIEAGSDSRTLIVDDGNASYDIAVTVSRHYPARGTDEGDGPKVSDCSTGSSGAPSRLIVILLLGWMGLRAVAAAPRSSSAT